MGVILVDLNLCDSQSTDERGDFNSHDGLQSI